VGDADCQHIKILVFLEKKEDNHNCFRFACTSSRITQYRTKNELITYIIEEISQGQKEFLWRLLSDIGASIGSLENHTLQNLYLSVS